MSDKKINWLIGAVVVILLLFLMAPVIFNQETDEIALNSEEAITLAGDWIEISSPTYLFDGSDLSLVGVEEVECSKKPCYKVEFSFESATAGYGDRSDEMSAQVITPHNIVVYIEAGEVVEVVIDDEYIELERSEMVDEEEGDEEEVSEDDNSTESVNIPPSNSNDRIMVQVFFSNSIEDPEALECHKVYPLEREITNVAGIGRASIEELLSGATEAEEEVGYFSNINAGTRVNDLRIEDQVAYIDFDSKLSENVGGSCRVAAIRAQIEETLKQFSTVSEVIVSIDGETEYILEP